MSLRVGDAPSGARFSASERVPAPVSHASGSASPSLSAMAGACDSVNATRSEYSALGDRPERCLPAQRDAVIEADVALAGVVERLQRADPPPHLGVAVLDAGRAERQRQHLDRARRGRVVHVLRAAEGLDLRAGEAVPDVRARGVAVAGVIDADVLAGALVEVADGDVHAVERLPVRVGHALLDGDLAVVDGRVGGDHERVGRGPASGQALVDRGDQARVAELRGGAGVVLVEVGRVQGAVDGDQRAAVTRRLVGREELVRALARVGDLAREVVADLDGRDRAGGDEADVGSRRGGQREQQQGGAQRRATEGRRHQPLIRFDAVFSQISVVLLVGRGERDVDTPAEPLRAADRERPAGAHGRAAVRTACPCPTSRRTTRRAGDAARLGAAHAAAVGAAAALERDRGRHALLDRAAARAGSGGGRALVG